MRKIHINILTIICVFVAFWLPASMNKSQEAGKPLTVIKPIKALQVDNFGSKDEVAEIIPTVPQGAPNAFNGSGDYYLDWIISRESGGNPYAMNSIGACGLPQSLPCSKLLSRCSTLDNVSCQIDWMRDYCIARYGSTYGAYLYWQAHSNY